MAPTHELVGVGAGQSPCCKGGCVAGGNAGHLLAHAAFPLHQRTGKVAGRCVYSVLVQTWFDAKGKILISAGFLPPINVIYHLHASASHFGFSISLLVTVGGSFLTAENVQFIKQGGGESLTNEVTTKEARRMTPQESSGLSMVKAVPSFP